MLALLGSHVPVDAAAWADTSDNDLLPGHVQLINDSVIANSRAPSGRAGEALAAERVSGEVVQPAFDALLGIGAETVEVRLGVFVQDDGPNHRRRFRFTSSQRVNSVGSRRRLASSWA